MNNTSVQNLGELGEEELTCRAHHGLLFLSFRSRAGDYVRKDILSFHLFLGIQSFKSGPPRLSGEMVVRFVTLALVSLGVLPSDALFPLFVHLLYVHTFLRNLGKRGRAAV